MTRSIAASLALWLAASGWNIAATDRESVVIETWRPQLKSVPRPEIVGALSLGYDAVLADLYWIAALQYFGTLGNARVGYPQLSQYIKLVNYLAPDFEYAYVFGGMAIPWNLEGQWVNVEQAVEVLNQGLQRFPSNWFMRLMVAYDESTYLHHYRAAGEQLMRASQTPGSPAYLGALAAKMLIEDGTSNVSEVLGDVMAEASDPAIREALQKRFDLETARRLEQQANQEVQDYAATTGQAPASLRDLPGWRKWAVQTRVKLEYDRQLRLVTASVIAADEPPRPAPR